MKSTGTIQAGTGLWQDPNTDATNESGFSGLPAGWRDYFGAFGTIGDLCFLWSSSEYNFTYAWLRTLRRYTGSVDRFDRGDKMYGFSVRCLRD